MPGIMLSLPSAGSPMGTRTGGLQVAPSVELLSTMSLPAHDARNRQSCQTTYTRPAPSTSADGSGPERRLPSGGWAVAVDTVDALLHVAPPSVERNAMIDV